MNIALAVFVAIFGSDRDEIRYDRVIVDKSVNVYLVTKTKKCVFESNKYTVLSWKGKRIRIFYDGHVAVNTWETKKLNDWVSGVNINKCK